MAWRSTWDRPGGRGLPMTDPRVLVVGAGPAGVAAAIELARAGLPVLLVDLAPRAGGAIHRQPIAGGPGHGPRAQRRRWARLMTDLAALRDRVTCAFGTRFCGVDSTGTVLLTGAIDLLFRPRAVVLAVGARERVLPRPGWTLPGVETAGSLQSRLKTLGSAPEGRVLLAGSGPLLLAVGAELLRLGRPPVAIVEAARPFAAPWRALGLPPSYLAEAAAYLARLAAARVPVLTGAELTAIAPDAGGLSATVETRRGARTLAADLVALHDGIAPDTTGLSDSPALPVLRLGDCRAALGGRAAIHDGRAGGRALAARLLGRPAPAPDPDPGLAAEARAQARLAQVYARDGGALLAGLPGDTVICRCEHRTLDDLRALGPAPTARQLRLDGRFAMGACQGRFCGDNLRALLAGAGGAPPRSGPAPGATRWPPRPIPIAALVAATDETEGDDG